GLGERTKPAVPRARIEEGLVRGKPVLPDDALREIPALQRRRLRADEGHRPIRIALAVRDSDHVAVEAQLDGGLPRDLQARRRGVEARRQERDEDRQAYGDPEARDREPAVPVEDREVVAQVSRRLAELGVEDRRRELSVSRRKLPTGRISRHRDWSSVAGEIGRASG